MNKKISQRAGIPDLNRIRAQFKVGISIRQLSLWWNVPYATLYRALKGRVDRKKIMS